MSDKKVKEYNMRAFVKATNGVFANLNFYMAWEGFNTMGYSVTLFEEKDIPTLDVTPDTPVFAGVTVFRKIIDKLGINYSPFDCYPEVLKPYYGRNLRKSTLGEEKTKFNKDNIPVFVKPVLPKQFIGNVWKSMLNLIPLANIPDDAKVWVCEPIEIMSEFRAYVHEGEILGVKHYYGDWSIIPDKEFIERVVKAYNPCPIAYGIDFAMIKRHTKEPREWENLFHYYPVVLEINDGCNLGNYGLDSIHYGEMIVSRWFEIMGSKMNKVLGDQMVNEMKHRSMESNIDKHYDKLLNDVLSKQRKVPYAKVEYGSNTIHLNSKTEEC